MRLLPPLEWSMSIALAVSNAHAASKINSVIGSAILLILSWYLPPPYTIFASAPELPTMLPLLDSLICIMSTMRNIFEKSPEDRKLQYHFMILQMKNP